VAPGDPDPGGCYDHQVCARRSESAEPQVLGLPGRPIPTATLLRLQDILLTTVGVGAVVVVLFMALVHLQDRAFSDHVSGAWMAFTSRAQHGTPYPPLYDGTHYGGTRWMPLALGVNLAFAALGTDLIFTGKLASLALGSATLAVLYALLRRLGVDRPMAVCLTGVTALSEPLLLALWAPYRGDSPAALLQLLALYVALQRPLSARAAGVAGGLSGLAILAKASAGWAPMAIGCLLLFSDRRRLGLFVGAFVGVAGLGLATASVLTDGRMWESLTALSTGQLGLRRLLGSPQKMMIILERTVQPLWLLLPVGVAELVGAAALGRWALHHLAFGAAGVVAWVVFADPGVYSNHFIDLMALTALAVGGLWVRLGRLNPASWGRGLLAALVVWAAAGGYDVKVSEEVKAWWRGTADHGLDIYARLARPDDLILSEDPTVPVRLGQTPVVMDAFMWRRIDELHPELTRPLYARVEAEEFDRIILLYPAEAGILQGWYRRAHFSEPFIRAILAHYRLAMSEQGFHVFVPATRTAPAGSPGAVVPQ
jgi:hypothetical protein